MTETPPTKTRLAKAIRDFAPCGRLEEFASLAEQGYYDELESPLASPMTVLIADMGAHNAGPIALCAMAGEFDMTKAEAEAYFESKGVKVGIARKDHDTWNPWE